MIRRAIKAIRASLMRTHIAQLRMAAGQIVPADAHTTLIQAWLYARAAEITLELFALEHPHCKSIQEQAHEHQEHHQHAAH